MANNPIKKRKMSECILTTSFNNESLPLFSFQNDIGYTYTSDDVEIVIKELVPFLNHVTPVAMIVTKYLCTTQLKRELIHRFDGALDNRIENMINIVCSDEEIFILCEDKNVYVFDKNNKQYIREFKISFSSNKVSMAHHYILPIISKRRKELYVFDWLLGALSVFSTIDGHLNRLIPMHFGQNGIIDSHITMSFDEKYIFMEN